MSTQLADGLAKAIAVRQARQQARANLYALDEQHETPTVGEVGETEGEISTDPAVDVEAQTGEIEDALKQLLGEGVIPRVYSSPTLTLAKPTDPMFLAIGPQGVRMYKDRRPKSPRREEDSTPDRSSVALPLADGSSIRAEITPLQQQQIINTALEIQRNISEKSRIEVEVQKSQIWTNRMNTGFTVLGVVVFALGVLFGVRKETHS